MSKEEHNVATVHKVVKVPVVKLVNPEAVDAYLASVGKFAAICYAEDRNKIQHMTENLQRKIGLTCIRSGHMSGARHQPFIFEISEISRTCSHQLVRHSQGVNINQRSQRYVDELAPAYFIPKSIAEHEHARHVYIAAMDFAWESMQLLKSFGIPGDDRREVLPNATLTDLNIALSFQALMHLCNERLCTRASYQIRSIAEQARDLVIERELVLGEFLVPKCDYLGYCNEVNSCGRKEQRS